MIETDKRSNSKVIVESQEEPSSRVPEACSRGHTQVTELRRTTYDIFYVCRGTVKVKRPESSSLRMSSPSVKGPEFESQPCDWVEKVSNGPKRRGWATQSFKTSRNVTKAIVLAEVARQKSRATVATLSRATGLSVAQVDGVLRRGLNARYPTIERTARKHFAPPSSEIFSWRLTDFGVQWLGWAIVEELCELSNEEIEASRYDFEGIEWT